MVVPVASLWAAGFAQLHFTITKLDARFTTFDQLGYHLYLSVQGLLKLFNANFFGAPELATQTFAELINFGLLALIFVCPLILRVTRRELAWWQWFVVLQPHFIVLVYLMSNQASDLSSVRYLVLVPFYGAIGLALLIGAITHARIRLFLGVVILGCAAANAFPIATTLAAGYQSPNARDFAIVRMAQQHGLTKGYADYWSGNINTYVSGYRIQFIPASCAPDGLHFYAWLVDDAVLRRQAAQSFYVYDSQAGGSAACGPATLNRQFGSPAEVIAIDNHTTIFVYNYDITVRLA
jgi:hypothetical protein